MKKNTRKTDKLGRRQYSLSERRKLVSKYESSGLSQAAFCRNHKLFATTFNTWLRMFGKSKEAALPVTFAEADLVIPSGLAVEVEYPDGRRLKLFNLQMRDEHAAFIRQVASC